MNKTGYIAIVISVFGMALAFVAGIAVGENAAPVESKGVQAGAATFLELAKEIDYLDGRQLRMRVVTIEPGGVVGVHSHSGRPAVAYMVQGILTEHRDGGVVHTRQPGDTWSEGKDVTHWAENQGGETAIVVAVDVFKP